MSRLNLLLIALCTIVIATPVAAQSVYQWKDAKGVTHYADSPPAGKTYENRLIQQSGDSSAQPTTGEAKESVESANCKTARTNLERLNSGVPVGIDRNGDGKPDANLTAEERDSQAKLAQATIDTACGKAKNADK